MKRFFIVFILCLMGLNSKGQLNLRRVASFPTELNEISGIQYVQQNFWAINDGGNPTLLYQIDTFGNILRSFFIPATNIDWEDLCSDGDSMLYIGDFGNNNNNRTDLAIYRINLNQPQNDTFYPVRLPFSYSDQFGFPPSGSRLHFDCEAFIIINDTFHLFSKNRTFPFDGWVKHYQLPVFSKNNIALLIDSFQLGGFMKELFWVTSAAYNEQKNTLYLLSSDKVYSFNNSRSNDIFGGTFTTISFGDISQKEGICLDDNDNIWITDEANNGPAGLYTLDQMGAKQKNIIKQKLMAHFSHDSGIIAVSEQTEPGRLSITHLNGELVFKKGYQQSVPIAIPTIGWAKGVYILQYTTKEQNFLTKIKIY